MVNNFKIEINNMGKIRTAQMKVGLINVIGGRNASGKSFTSKLLFCFLTSLSNHGNHLDNNAIKELYLSLTSYCKKYFITTHNMDEFNTKTEKLMDTWNNEEVSYDYLENFNKKYNDIIHEYKLDANTTLKSSLEDISKTIQLHKNPLEHYKTIMQTLIKMEFGQTSLKNFEGATVSCECEYNNTQLSYKLEFLHNTCNIDISSNKVPSLLEGNIIYLDSPSPLDFSITPSRNYMQKTILTNKSYHNVVRL